MHNPDENKMQGNIEWLKTYDLDLEDVVSCDTVKCENPATHYAKVKCCGAVIVGCEKCLHDAYKVVLYMIKNNKSIMCKSCQTSNAPEGWISKPEKLSLL